MATDIELSEFLKNMEKMAFKRALYHVRNEDAALDIVQDTMIKLCSHYADKPVAELPLLFQRILSNTMLDWFRRQKTRNTLFTNFSEFGDNENFDLLASSASSVELSNQTDPDQWLGRVQTMTQIEIAVQSLPPRQREAFMLRYGEELDVSETASVMGCSEGSVKTHCSRAIQALSQKLGTQGFKP